MRLVVALAAAGVRQQLARWLVLALGIAIAAAFPVIAGGMRVSAEAAAVRAAVEQTPSDQRLVVAVTGRTLAPGEATSLDAEVRHSLLDAGLADPARYLVYRPLRLSGTDLTLAATDTLADQVRVTSGALPTACTPERCEVVLTSTPSSPPVDITEISAAAAEVGVIITGTAEITDGRPAGAGLFDAQQPLLLGASADGMGRLASLSLFGRITAWLSPLDGAVIVERGVEPFGRTLTALTEELNTRFGGLTVRWPAERVGSASARAVTSANRFTVLGATGAALQLGFCVAAAVGIRSRQLVVSRLLRRRGAGPAQLVAVPLLQATAVVTTGVTLGGGLGALSVWLMSGDGPPRPAVAAGQALQTGWLTLLVVAIGAIALSTAVVLWPTRAGRATRVALDALLVAAAAVIVLAVNRDGAVTPDDPLTLSVTTLVALVAGLVTARLWPLALWALSRITGATGTTGATRTTGTTRSEASTVWRIALLGGQRRYLRPAVTGAFVAAAICSVVFAGAYRLTLDESAADQAVFQVPLAAQVTPSRTVATPLSVLDVSRIRALGSGVTVHPVVSSSVTVFSGTSAAASLPLTGVDRGTLPLIDRFEAVTGASESASALDAALADDSAGTATTAAVPAGGHRLAIRASGSTQDVVVSVWLATPDGAQTEVVLSDSSGSAELAARVELAQDTQLVAVEVAESPVHLTRRQHAVGEGHTDQPMPSGTLTFDTVSVDGTPLSLSWTGWGSDQATVDSSSGQLSITYRLTESRLVITPGFVPRADLPPLRVASDPLTAASAGSTATMTVNVGGLTVRAAIVAVLPRMPTLGARFLLADRSAVTALLTRVAPGTAPITQVWISAPDADLDALRSELRVPPASTATVTVQSDVRAALLADPVATRSVSLLLIAAVMALVMAMTALALSVTADRTEEAGDYLVWEIDGLAPRALRRVLVLRSGLIAAIGVPMGLIGGWILTEIAVRLLAVGAAGTDTQPPLRAVFGWGWALTAVAVALVASGLASGAAAATTLRERLPRSPDVDLR